MDKLKRLQKYVEGGKIRKFDTGGGFNSEAYLRWREKNNHLTEGQARAEFSRIMNQPIVDTEDQDNLAADAAFGQQNGFNSVNERLDQSLQITAQNPVSEQERAAADSGMGGDDGPAKKASGLSGGGNNVPWGMIGDAAIGVNNAIDDAVVGDKNFSQSSQALDAGVDAAASMASKFGPWGLLAAGILKTANSATKYLGKNVQGFDVNIDNSGYGNIGHMESQAGRVWDNGAKTQRLLAKRNEQARMALAAADISEDTAYEQEARANSVTNILQQNQIALSGGIDTSLLGN